MKRIIELFDQSYIINLQHRTDRRHQARREFRRIGITVPGEKVQFYTASRPLDKGGFMDIGTRGAFESHKRILESAINDDLRNVIIFEDDICFRRVGEDFERALLAQLANTDWDVIFFGYIVPDEERLSGPLVRWTGDILGAHFYAVNGKFMPRMLRYLNECELRPRDHPEGGPMPIDGAYNHIRYVAPDINLFLAFPYLAYQRSSRTDIAKAHILDDVGWLKPVMRGARAVKHWYRMELDKRKLGRQLGGR